ncbi:MAG: penicillin-binding protein 1C [Dysgonamonadaceae bacterium]|jgi:penicillin-binding protein 1C|nr:penicillin-binding protein 1C [Dysgonamonadaceae bacterium]
MIAAVLLVAGGLMCIPNKLFDSPYSTVVSDRNHELLGARIASDNQWRFPPVDTVPAKFKTCLIAFEDRYFYYHWGVNPVSIARSLIQNIRAKRIVSGASTITMQVIRLSRKKKRTFKEKCLEMLLATHLELRTSKEKILGLYASHAPFGGNVVGLETASWRYFGHSSNALSWAEAATLAILPNAPAQIHLSRNRASLLRKRNRLLQYLKEQGVIDESTFSLALTEPLPEKPLPLPQIAPHLVSHFFQYHNGENCISTIDKRLQIQAEQILERWNHQFSASDINNIAAIIIDVERNQVVTYCGNISSEKYGFSEQVDIIRAPRSTGSILKPFLYCALLQEGQLLRDMLQPDIPININGFQPQNFNRQFDGAVPASEALTRSLNVPAVYELRNYSVPKFYTFLQKAGISTLSMPPSHYGLSLILGGAEASLWDIASAYTDMARTLRCRTRNEAYSRKQPDLLLISQVTDTTSRQSIYHPGAVWQTMEVLKEVNRPEEIDWRHIRSMRPVAWKTGTSYGFRDAWAVGVTPHYVVGVWTGNADGIGKPELTGARTAGPVMFDLFNILPQSAWFAIPYSDLTETAVCRESGHKAGIYCDHVDTVLLCSEGLKTNPCPYHQPIYVTNDERYRVYRNCALDNDIKQVNWFILPPAWAWYYKQQNPSYRNLPPVKPGCNSGNLEKMMQFIYPQSNAVITIPRQLDGSEGKVVFELAHNNPSAIVYWHLDEDFIGSTDHFHQISLTPSPGKHVVTVVDGEGNRLSVKIEIK